MTWFLVPAILCSGCALGPPPPPEKRSETEAELIERIRARCPTLPAADREILRRAHATAKAPLGKAQLRVWIGELHLDAAEKAAAGERIANMYDRCLGVTSGASTS
jgi:hypothetical protein